MAESPIGNAGLLADVRGVVQDLDDVVLDTSHQIHARPGIRFQEHFASDLLAHRLREHGFDVITGIAGLDRLLSAVQNCARGAALATGAEVVISEQAPIYAALRPNPVLGGMIEDDFALLGRKTAPALDVAFPGSTDMGNVSEVVPAAHPNIEFVPGLAMHSHVAAEYAGGEVGDRAALDGSVLLALTAAQLFSNEERMVEVRAAFVGVDGQ